MSIEKILSTVSVVLLTLMLSVADAKDYFIDSQKKGDSILLKKGMVFTGMLEPKGSGDENAVVRVSTYGKGARPKIEAKGKNMAGLFLKDLS